MAMASLIHAGCGYPPRFSNNCNNCSFRIGSFGPFGSSSPSSSCSCSSSSSPNLNFRSGTNNNWKHQGHRAQAMSTATQGNSASSKSISNGKNEPDHLLVLVHGILASPSDWTYVEAELKRRLGRNFLIYASSCNTYTKTFTGVDGAGKRLADEGNLQTSRPSGRGTIAGLEAVSFITLATPHLGVRGRKQLPFLLGVPILEKLAPPIAPFFVGRTGKQLFLTDGKPNRPPLLLRMASDCEDGKFLSALGAFRCRIAYANVSYDHMVGWRTSSIRREKELVKPPLRSLDGYKHVVDVDYRPPVSSDGPSFPPEAVKAKEAAQNAPSVQNTVEYHELMEEEMIQGLQKLGWKKVDVSFHSALWPFFAHNNIHVKNEWFHNAGAGVVAHVADSLKQQESSSPFISASL
ncbi:uncharacterized protein LOC110424851 isoform X2 [Herrania umbratica]|uniref:Uncharacterized protein LOC110424851 isoform X2 n=1 Tax=Herrania umbratica TaxID=108875 RepID=A0A6J1B9V4_9ROSI|nr:uncharacterized protein LOC110424851 isoform X2 [Herrania umbratica]